jgi:protein phosphatase methylesterase 1
LFLAPDDDVPSIMFHGDQIT